MRDEENKATGSATLVLIGMVVLGIPLLLMLAGVFRSPEVILVCLPVGLGLIMWAGIKERSGKIGVITFAVGLMITFIGIGMNLTPLLVIGGIASTIGAFSWSLFKD